MRGKMKWLEIIELRSVGRDQGLLESQFKELVKEVDKEANRQAIKAYSRVMRDTDFSFHLFHDSDQIEPGGSPLGLQIASSLKEFGLVNHTVWIEMHNH
jgi:hypothetical protein